MKTSKQKKPKKVKISVTLSEREGELLKLYAAEQGTSRPAALRRILRERLKDYVQQLAKEGPKNQLGLFDSVQIDIFNNTSRAEE